MASWRPLGSILEAPGLDFRGRPKVRFERPWAYFWFVFWKTYEPHMWRPLLTNVGMHFCLLWHGFPHLAAQLDKWG